LSGIIAFERNATYVFAVMLPGNRSAHSLVALVLGLFLAAFLLARHPARTAEARPPAGHTELPR
jgi:hypothetical protein